MGYFPAQRNKAGAKAHGFVTLFAGLKPNAPSDSRSLRATKSLIIPQAE
jgi:hypothetical protein